MPEQRLEHVPEDWERAMAIVAHPDDIEYGTASAVARWTAQGKEVVYLLVTRGEAGIDAWSPEKTGQVREAEERAGALCVGVDTVEFLDYRDGVIEYGLPLRRDLARMIRRYRPEVIVTQNIEIARRGGNINQADHRAVGLASCDAARDAGNRWIFPELVAEGLKPWNGIRHVFIPGVGDATHYCDVSDGIERGIEALRSHKAYIDNLDAPFDPDPFLRKPAAERGAQFGCQYATVFKVLRI